MDFTSLYKELFKPVFAYVYCRVTERAAAEDVCACVWRKAYEKLSSFDEQKGSFRQWIFTIARNETNMYYRTYYVRKFLSLTGFEDAQPDENAPAAEDPLAEQEDVNALLLAMKVLTAREKDLVALKFYSGLTNREIARQTGLSESNVGTLISRSVAKLRKEMKL